MYLKKLLPTGCGSPSFEGKGKKKSNVQYKHSHSVMIQAYLGTVKLRNGPHSFVFIFFLSLTYKK